MFFHTSEHCSAGLRAGAPMAGPSQIQKYRENLSVLNSFAQKCKKTICFFHTSEHCSAALRAGCFHGWALATLVAADLKK